MARVSGQSCGLSGRVIGLDLGHSIIKSSAVRCLNPENTFNRF
jgi:hypothetical protein